MYIGGSIRFLVRTNSVTVGEDLVISDKLTHNSDTNTMMRFPEDNTITFENNNVGETLRIAGTGNIGIGTTNPTAKLDVNGSLNVAGISTFGGVVGFSSNVNVGGLSTSTDRVNVNVTGIVTVTKDIFLGEPAGTSANYILSLIHI